MSKTGKRKAKKKGRTKALLLCGIPIRTKPESRSKALPPLPTSDKNDAVAIIMADGTVDGIIDGTAGDVLETEHVGAAQKRGRGKGRGLHRKVRKAGWIIRRALGR